MTKCFQDVRAAEFRTGRRTFRDFTWTLWVLLFSTSTWGKLGFIFYHNHVNFVCLICVLADKCLMQFSQTKLEDIAYSCNRKKNEISLLKRGHKHPHQDS